MYNVRDKMRSSLAEGIGTATTLPEVVEGILVNLTEVIEGLEGTVKLAPAHVGVLDHAVLPNPPTLACSQAHGA